MHSGRSGGHPLAKGDNYCRGCALATPKFTDLTSFPSVLVVRKDDNAASLDGTVKLMSYGCDKPCATDGMPCGHAA